MGRVIVGFVGPGSFSAGVHDDMYRCRSHFSDVERGHRHWTRQVGRWEVEVSSVMGMYMYG